MKLYPPAGSTQVSVRGVTIYVDADGAVNVPNEVMDDMISCGCTIDKPVVMTQAQKANQTKAQLKAQKSYDDAVLTRDGARQALFQLEGRGDVTATANAAAALATAETAVTELGAGL